jgi:adenosine deaminase
MVRAIVVLVFTTVAAFGQAASTAASSRIERKFAELRKNPPELYAFLYRMPKGADLHNHLSGAVYAESFIRAAADNHYCIDKKAMAIARPPCAPGQVDAALTDTDNNLRNALIDSMSMRNFVAGTESGHDHFFATFDKFGAVDSGEFVAEIAQRAGDQNESYVELMALSGGGAIGALGRTVGLDDDFDVTRQKLEAGGLPALVGALKTRVDQMELTRRRILGCQGTPNSAACRVKIHYVYQVLRESAKEQIFAQVLGGFALASSDPRVVGVNFVQPEDGVNSMRDYHLQMRMVDYARRVYPTVHVTLHAGELAPGLVPPEGLQFHIREAVELAHAERIGHGVDIMFEKDPDGLLKEMRDRHVAVEINLTSNDVILGISGDKHPFNVYRKNRVPMALSTDDEGVSRSQLTEEFQRAVLSYNLTYNDLKELVRNSIEYSFAQGKSFWRNTAYSTPVPACVGDRQSADCKAWIKENEKAGLEADLEERFAVFERDLR